MCGIVGYIGTKNAYEVVLEGLKRLEYRGYDSAGLAIQSGAHITCTKSCGRIKNLENKCKNKKKKIRDTAGIAHTRWATHGRPAKINAHPHTDCSRKIYLVHNGIIENFQSLKKWLMEKGHRFYSSTDTEVISHLIEEYYNGDLKSTVSKVTHHLKGAFAFAVIHKDEPDKMVLARFGSPLVIGLGDREFIAASDVAAIVLHTRNVIYLNDGEMAEISNNDIKLFNFEKEELDKDIAKIEWDIAHADKKGYPHFMLKEICEQPVTIQDSIRGRVMLDKGNAKLGGLDKVEKQIRGINKIKMVVCGTARHAALVGKYYFEELANLAAEVDFASEFRYRQTIWDKKTAVIGISQSGETADTLAAIREGKEKGALTLGITNTVGSTIARETDAGIYNHIGPEISVASTKAFTSQLVVLLLLAVKMGRQRSLSLTRGREILKELNKIPAKISRILKQQDYIKELADRYKNSKHFAFLGRKFNYPLALEGALKVKEISYIHSEGLPSGEIKHGSIALIDKKFPSFIIAPEDSVYEKNISNLQEIKSRCGEVIAIATEGNKEIKKLTSDIIYIPETIEILNPVLTAVPMQLFAYYLSSLKGLDVDKPRNLAKSVTVE